MVRASPRLQIDVNDEEQAELLRLERGSDGPGWLQPGLQQSAVAAEGANVMSIDVERHGDVATSGMPGMIVVRNGKLYCAGFCHAGRKRSRRTQGAVISSWARCLPTAGSMRLRRSPGSCPMVAPG